MRDSDSVKQQSPTAKTTHAATLNQKKEEGNDVLIHFAVSSMRGRRKSQEDANAVESELRAYEYDNAIIQNKSIISHDVLPNHALFAVFDGHGTSFASNYAAMYFVSTLCRQTSFVEYSHKYLSDHNKQQPKSSNSARKKKGNKTEYTTSMNNQAFPKDDNDAGQHQLRFLLEDAIKSTMIELDANMLKEMTTRKSQRKERSHEDEELLYDEFDSGTTAIIIILTPHYIICANLGDSRAILQRGDNKNDPICLSNDHKPYNELEELRIRNAGGVVISGNIEGRLAVSRGLGDFNFKHMQSVLYAAADKQNNDNVEIDAYMEPENQMVSSVPEFIVLTRVANQDKFLVIACDGIWDVTSNEKCAEMISKIFNEGEQSIALACEEVLDQCYVKGSLDNMTAILVKFPSQEVGFGGGVMKRRKQRRRKGR